MGVMLSLPHQEGVEFHHYGELSCQGKDWISPSYFLAANPSSLHKARFLANESHEDAVTQLLSQQKITAALLGQLVQEISYLLGCAAHLLSLTPHKVQFHYPSTEATG
jgi:hypothetical protein